MTRTSPIWVQECVVIYLRIPGSPNFSYSYDGLNRIMTEGHALSSGNVATNYTYHSSTQGQSGRIASL
ncbi:MAG: hypothetical protein IJ241_08940, partial [Clostridia bacterium]|nr:hypothetical protein [Clostridia bacterium]